MKNYKQYLFAILLALLAGNASAKLKQTKVYAFGFAASFNDSTVYFTDVQEIDSAWVNEGNHFLYSRENYSYQLRDYLKGQGVSYPTPITSFALKRKTAEKNLATFRKKYTEKGKFDVRYIKESEFRYAPIAPEEEK